MFKACMRAHAYSERACVCKHVQEALFLAWTMSLTVRGVQTLELLCRMTNPANVTVITDKLVGYLSATVDPFLRKDLVPRIIQLAERFAPDNTCVRSRGYQQEGREGW